MLVNKSKFVLSYIGGLIWIVLFILLHLYPTKIIGQLSVIFLLLQAIILLGRTIKVKNSLLLVIFAFMSLYIWPTKLFFFNDLYFSAHHQSFTYFTAIYTTLLFALFFLILNLTIKIQPISINYKVRFKQNDIIFYGLFIITLLIILVFKRSGSHYDGTGGEVKVSSLYEYSLILIMLLYIYTNNKKPKLILFYILCFLYVFFTIIVGGRIEVILLALLLLTIKYQYIISFKKIIFLLLIGIWFMSIFENVRQNPTILFTNDILSILNPFNDNIGLYKFQSSNEGDVFWASERMIILLEENEITFFDRIEAALNYLLSSFVPSSFLSPLGNLANYKINVYTTGGGGLAIAYYYVMFGFIGVIGLGLFFGYIINKLSTNSTAILRFYVILLITTLPRWFAYNPIHLIKFCIWGTLCYCMIQSLDYTMRKYYRIVKGNTKL